MNQAPGARECLAALGRLSGLQSRSISGGKMLSLGRVLAAKEKYLRLLDKALLSERPRLKAGGTLSVEDENLRLALSHLMREDERNINQALGKLEEICGELDTLRNRGKLLGSYGS